MGMQISVDPQLAATGYGVILPVETPTIDEYWRQPSRQQTRLRKALWRST